MDDIWAHYGQWWAVLVFIAIYAVFLAFTPFYRKSRIKPSGAFMAFAVAFALEMFGVPFSMYTIAWAFGQVLPEGILWGHTLVGYVGDLFANLNYVFGFGGLALVILGWRDIHKYYWSKESGKGKLVTQGIYAYIRHPQYTGFFLATFGMLLEWITIPLLIMWPMIFILYYRLARREEKDLEKEFGKEYTDYKKRTSMFIPLPKIRRA